MPSTLLERIAAGRTDLIFDYLALGHAATSTDKDGGRLSGFCLYYGDVSALKLLLERGETLASLGRNFDLNGAAFYGHWKMCEFLLESGADPNDPLPDTGETPLHAALCTRRRTARDLVIRVLLDRGANPNAKTTPGVETGGFMRDCRTKGETPLHRAAAFGGEETIDMLLSAGASREALDVNGDTPLSWGSWYTRPDAILRKLCYGPFSIRPGRKSMDAYTLGEPLRKG